MCTSMNVKDARSIMLAAINDTLRLVLNKMFAKTVLLKLEFRHLQANKEYKQSRTLKNKKRW